MKRFWFRLTSLIGLVSLLLSLPALALAHPLDQHLQATYLTISSQQVIVELNMTPGVLVAPGIISALDTNADQQISAAEGQIYAQMVVSKLMLQLDGQSLALNITSIEMPPYLNLQVGYGLIKIFVQATLPANLTGAHRLYYKNNYVPEGPLYQVNTFVEQNAPVKLVAQERDDIQQSINVSYELTTATVPAVATASAVVVSSSAATGQLNELFGVIQQPELSPWLLMVALGLALLLGGLHALTPGHGKTLVAAYLVGSRGSARHAVILGGIVTFTHTISVIAVGLFALVASRFILPTALAPTLEIIAGLLVLGLGLRLVWQRWTVSRANRSHGHNHPHSHALPEKVKMGDLWAMGISGGLVPCPEALGILLIAVGLNRVGLGLSLIVAFSLGVAVVLIVIGLLLVRSRGLLDKLGKRGGKVQRWLPLVSAAIVTLLGIGIAAKGLVSYPQQLQGLATIIVLALTILTLTLVFVLARRKAPQSRVVPVKKTISSTPMSSAPMVYQPDGQVAWDEMWTDFCDLALAGGPPHRGTLLEPVEVEEARADPANYTRVLDELERGLRLITNLPIVRDATPGWIGLVCSDEAMAAWLTRAIIVENVIVRRESAVLFLPAGPDFGVEKEIKNVITVVAKTHHYWMEHNAEAAQLSLK